uniref:GDT1 family protein n=1 Tax=Lactuca sativa TaxID=4236 RepID=A0A9R1WNF8_LACSA|nr:hypothetical protein LSAT_V11C100050440 [Lactuca sativa]
MWVIKTQSLEPEDISPPPDEDCRRAEGGTNFYKAVLYMFLFLVIQQVLQKSGVILDSPEEQKKKVVVERIKNNVIGDKIDPKAVLNLDPGLGVLDAFFASLSMILVSEIGDETFIIAALMAMHHPKSIVLSGALSALFVMTILSTGLGRIVPNLISRKHTNSVATVLYAFFGLCLLYIAWRSDSKASQKKEMEQVEEKLESRQVKKTKSSLRFLFAGMVGTTHYTLKDLNEQGLKFLLKYSNMVQYNFKKITRVKLVEEKNMKPLDSNLAALSARCSKDLELNLAKSFLSEMSQCTTSYPYNSCLEH